MALGGSEGSSGVAVFLAACFFRVAELAEDFGLPLTMVNDVINLNHMYDSDRTKYKFALHYTR